MERRIGEFGCRDSDPDRRELPRAQLNRDLQAGSYDAQSADFGKRLGLGYPIPARFQMADDERARADLKGPSVL